MINLVIQLLALTLGLVSTTITAGELDYKLSPKKVAESTYVLIGAKEDFSYENGGNIVNTGFIVTEDGVVVIDTGPSYLYGQQMREAISEITDKPIIKVLITHHHPDHLLGSKAYQTIPVYALPETITLIKRDIDGFLDNVYRMSGPWMRDTDFNSVTIQPLTVDQETIADHSFKYLKLNGHTTGDLAIFDESTGVLFAGDLVFHNRTLTTPHAEPKNWLNSLDVIIKQQPKIIIPGHGEVAYDTAPVEQTRDYLLWVDSAIKQAVADGKDMNEVLATPIPKRFHHLGVLKTEFTRTVTHRYPVYEKLLLE